MFWFVAGILALIYASIIYPRLKASFTGEPPFSEDEIRDIKGKVLDLNDRIAGYSELILGRRPRTDIEETGEAEADSIERIDKIRKGKITTPKPLSLSYWEHERDIFTAMAVPSAILWPFLVLLNALVASQILELFLPISGQTIELPVVGAMSPVAVILSILVACAAAIFAFSLHAFSLKGSAKVIGIVGSLLLFLTIFGEGYGAWVRGEYTEEFMQVGEASFGLLTAKTSLVSAAIAVIVVCSEAITSYFLFKGVLIPLIPKLVSLPMLIILYFYRCYLHAKYGPYFDIEGNRTKRENILREKEKEQYELSLTKAIEESASSSGSLKTLKWEANELLGKFKVFHSNHIHPLWNRTVEPYSPLDYIKTIDATVDVLSGRHEISEGLPAFIEFLKRIEAKEKDKNTVNQNAKPASSQFVDYTKMGLSELYSTKVELNTEYSTANTYHDYLFSLEQEGGAFKEIERVVGEVKTEILSKQRCRGRTYILDDDIETEKNGLFDDLSELKRKFMELQAVYKGLVLKWDRSNHDNNVSSATSPHIVLPLSSEVAVPSHSAGDLRETCTVDPDMPETTIEDYVNYIPPDMPYEIREPLAQLNAIEDVINQILVVKATYELPADCVECIGPNNVIRPANVVGCGTCGYCSTALVECNIHMEKWYERLKVERQDVDGEMKRLARELKKIQIEIDKKDKLEQMLIAKETYEKEKPVRKRTLWQRLLHWLFGI